MNSSVVSYSQIKSYGEVVWKSQLSVKDKERLKALGITLPEQKMSELRSIKIQCLNKLYNGIGLENSSKGIEIISVDDIKRPITLNSKGYICFPVDCKHLSKGCYVFNDFLDYYAFKSYQNVCKAFPEERDCYILCNPVEFATLMVRTDVYSDIALFLPNNTYGRTMVLSLMDRNRAHVTDCSGCYKGYQYFRQFVSDWMINTHHEVEERRAL
jgi:hypothetical protein